MPDEDTAAGQPQATDKISNGRGRFKWLQAPWSVGVGAAVIAGLVVYGIIALIQHLNPGPPPAPVLSLRDVVVTPAAAEPPRPEAVALTFLNKGNQAAILTRANVVIQQFMVLPAVPGSAIYLVPDHKYTITMPLRPYQGEPESKSLSETVGAGGVEDFALGFNLPPVPLGPVYLYRVSISVQYGTATKPVEVLISLPTDPGPVYKCSSSSHSDFCDFLRRPGYRSAAMSQLLP